MRLCNVLGLRRAGSELAAEAGRWRDGKEDNPGRTGYGSASGQCVILEGKDCR